jgi:HPr kinase/phosphorylase
MTDGTVLIHATAVSISGHGIMIGGRSGSGKSDLALRLIDRGAQLICDDYVALSDIAGALILTPAPNIAGKIEIRGLGIVAIPYVDSAPLRLYVDLDMEMNRHPDLWQTTIHADYKVPMIAAVARADSAVILIEMAVQKIVTDQVFPQKIAH